MNLFLFDLGKASAFAVGNLATYFAGAEPRSVRAMKRKKDMDCLNVSAAEPSSLFHPSLPCLQPETPLFLFLVSLSWTTPSTTH